MGLLWGVIIILTAIFTSSWGNSHLSSYQVVLQWKVVDYKWPTPQTRERLLQTKEFVPERNIITGLKLYKDNVYLTTPRWSNGIPSTLNVVKLNSVAGTTSSPPLEPYPSWEMQEIGNCNAFQLVQSMEVDEFGRMWIIDVGRLKLFSPKPENNCPAKLVIMDLETNRILKKYEFPPGVVSPTSNFLTDIVVGCDGRDKCWAYMSDALDSKIVVYSLEKDRSWFVHHKTMDFDPRATTLRNRTLIGNIDGIALSPKDSFHDRLYYTPVSSFGFYSVPTSVLQEAVNGMTLGDPDVTTHTNQRASQTDGMVMDSQGLIFYGGLRNNSVNYVDTRQPGGFDKENILVKNDVDLEFPDSFGFDDKGYLYILTNRLQRFFTGTVDVNDVNLRVVRVFTGSRSYLYSAAQDKVKIQYRGTDEVGDGGLYRHSRHRFANPVVGYQQPISFTPTVYEQFPNFFLDALRWW